MRLFIICLLSIGFCLNLNAQNHSFKKLRVEDGLSHNSVISMIQDHRGFLWFGTKDGLNRYDGYNYKIFQHKSTDLESLGSNFIRCLHEFNNYIWVGTDTGLFQYNERTESFKLIESTKDEPILDIENDNNGNLWFIAAGNLHKINLDSKNGEEDIYKQSYFSLITASKSGEIYTSTSQDIFKYLTDNNSFQKLEFDHDGETIITKVSAKESNDILYIGTKNNGALSYTLKNGKITSLLSEKENPLFVRDFLMKSKNELWIASESGIFIYNIDTGKYENLKKNYNNPYALSDNAIYSLVLDEEEGVWIGTYFGGVNYYPKQYTPINTYFPKVGENSISGNAVREIKKDKYGDLWIGTEDAGLNKLNLKTAEFINYPSIRNKGNLSHYNIHGLLPRGDKLWIGTFEHGLDVMDISSGKIIDHYGSGPNQGGLRSDFILYIYETKNEDLYILTSSGIHKYLKETNNFIVVKGFPEIYHYTYLIEDHEGVLWAGTYWDGLFYFNPKTGEKGFFKYDRNNSNSISSNVINGLFEDSSNNLWVTTENGLNLYNPVQKNFKRFKKEDGFPSNVTYSILEDEKKDLWISTSSGLLEFNKKTGSTKVYTKFNGLLSDQFNYSSAFRDSLGEMYFGSVNGLISFNPDQFIQNTYHPPIYITDIQINNKDVPVKNENSPLERSISFSKEIHLKSTQSTFNLEFASLSFTAPEMTKYWYKLDGLNKNWVALGKNHEVSFTELPPGDYTFKVKALNSHGVWSNENGNLKIEISPTFLASNLAYSFYVFFLVLISFLLLQYYHKYNKDKNNMRIRQLENEKEKEIYQAKIEFFTNIAHEIRTPLTLIKSPLEKLLKGSYKSLETPKNLGIMERNTSRLLDLVNELLDFRKTEMKHMKLTFIEVNIEEVLAETYLRFSQLIQDKNLTFDIKKQSEKVYAYVDEEAIRKILSNLFSNAIKYSQSKVQVLLETDDECFKIIVRNDGSIIPKELRQRIFEPFYRIPGETENLGTGIGLSLAYSLAELHQGKLFVDSSYPTLNTFILKIPLHQDEEFQAISKQIDQRPKKTNVGDHEIKFNKNAPIILIAEDNRELADFIFSELSENYNVLLSENGQEAIQLITRYDVQLVISDVMMPIKNGIELCKEIKENVITSHIPVVLLTAKSALNAKIEGLESGADAYISKPFSMDHLQVQISNLLENRRTILGHYNNSPLAYLKSLSICEVDQGFLSKLDNVIDDNLKDPNLNVELLAEYMNMSRSTLYRKIKEISAMSPNVLINISRLKKAAFLLKTTNLKIYEVSENVGFRSQTSFGRNFQKEFGMTPSEFINSIVT
jgi:signal transduction histidine kinase/ligand-binding sensor domain-containing protein/DNA-binding response OmpR family regulator